MRTSPKKGLRFHFAGSDAELIVASYSSKVCFRDVHEVVATRGRRMTLAEWKQRVRDGIIKIEQDGQDRQIPIGTSHG